MKKKALIIIADVLAAVISYGAALWLRFDLRMTTIPPEYLEGYGLFLPFCIVFMLIIYGLLKLYTGKI